MKNNAAFLFPFFLLLPGCGPGGPDLAPVTGVVMLDGSPVEGASVLFAPEAGGRPAEGGTDQQGHFALSTFEPGDGALVGRHKATVALYDLEYGGEVVGEDGLSVPLPGNQIREKWIVPKKYGSTDTSGLAFDVEHGMEPLRIELTTAENQ